MNRRQEILNEAKIDTTKLDKTTLLKIEIAMETYLNENLKELGEGLNDTRETLC